MLDIILPQGGFEDRVLYSTTHIDPPGDPRNPYPTWAELRGQPLKIVQPDPKLPPLVHLYRYRHVLDVNGDHRTYSSRGSQGMIPLAEYNVVAIDEPEHSYYRNLITPSLGPALVTRWKETLIPEVADFLLSRFARNGRGDLVQDYTFAFPALVMLRIIGFPQEEFEMFRSWAADISNSLADPERGWKAANEMVDYVRPYYEGAVTASEGSILDALLTARPEGRRLSYEEIQSFVLELVLAGLDTTYRALGTTLMLLLDRPEILARVRQDRTLVPKAIEESLRIDGPSVVGNRVAMRDVEIDGLKIPKGTWLIPVRSSANRDPDFAPDPDTFLLDRPPLRHLAFGNGIHVCLGQHIARLELAAAINAALDRLPNLRWDEAEKERLDPHIRGMIFRSPTSVPAAWDA